METKNVFPIYKVFVQTDILNLQTEIFKVIAKRRRSVIQNPQPFYCPDSWCKYQQLKAENQDNSYEHPLAFDKKFINLIKPEIKRSLEGRDTIDFFHA
ncbi:UNVERIFIED_CONTAM: hypothetical protein NCL1_21173 [Trichonephila clavipes]